MNNNNTMHEEKYRGFTIKFFPDENPDNPRTEWDNLGTMICSHRRYELGDIQAKDVDDIYQKMYQTIIGELPPDEMSNDAIMKICDKHGTVLPLYLYDHSGITMRTRPFSCQWDSGQVGVIVVSDDKMRKEFGKAYRKKAIKILECEVKTYDQYLTGDVYGFTITGDEDGEERTLDSCWGHYGWDYMMKDVLKECKATIDGHFKYQEEKGDPCYETVMIDEGESSEYKYQRHVHEDGKVEWLMDGLLHRVNGPAVEYPDGSRSYFQGGLFIKLHAIAGWSIEQTTMEGVLV